MYKKIVMARDGGPADREMLRQGAALAVSCQARVVLVAVISADLGIALNEAIRPPPSAAGGYDQAIALLEEGADTLRGHGLKVSQYVGIGEAGEIVSQIARTEEADLIVVGERRRGALARWRFGSTAASLLPNAPCSVLVSRAVVEASAARLAA